MESLLTTAPAKSQMVADHIVAEIRAGKLTPGARMYGMRELASRFQVSFTAVNQAYNILEDKKMIVRKARSGTFINPALKTNATKMLALITTVQEKSFENYFEPLLAEAADSNVIPIVGVIDGEKDWQDTIKKIIMREPDAFLIDVEARQFKLDELLKACAPFPCYFINRWEWHGIKPERAVLNDYPAAYGMALRYLKERGHGKVLIVGHHNPPYPFMREYFKKASTWADMEFGKELIYTSIGDIERTPTVLKKIFAENAPTAVFGLSDYLVHQFLQYALSASIDTSNLDKIGLFDQSYSNIPGHEFSSIRFNLQKIWKTVFNYCNKGKNSFVEYIKPEILIKQEGRGEIKTGIMKEIIL